MGRKGAASKGSEGGVAIDKVIHEPARYRIMSHLYVLESADFLFLLTQTGLTKGNLGSHIGKLETSGYITVVKEFMGKKPHTMLKLTRKGRKAFEVYRTDMRKMLEDLPPQ